MNMTFQKTLAPLLSGTLLLSCLPGMLSASSAAGAGTIRDMSTMEIVEDMGYGINLGNTFESTVDWDAAQNWIALYGDGTPNAYETAWGSPTVTEKMIQGYADEGFSTLRVPVAWSNMMAADGSYTINADYKARVRQVVDWALADNLYVILNLHWDGGWLENLPNDHDNCMKKYSVIWTQLCAEFKDYGDKLVFESQNEELYWNNVWNQWSGSTNGKEKAYGYCNEVNQKFVDIVRASGGNNAKRHLLISGYNTDVSLTCDSMFRMPNDTAGRCAVSVHYYIPSTFAILEEDASWGKCATTWGSASDVAELDKNMNLLKSTFVDKGIPVIIGEYGCPTRNKEAASVRKYLSAVCEGALKRGGICPVLWDITDLHYSRTTCQLKDRGLHDNFAGYGALYTQKAEVPLQQPDGVFIQKLDVFDTENGADWSIVSEAAVGTKLFGDRDLTVTAMPENLVGAELLRTACDSKLVTTDLGQFTAGKDATIYAAVDTRVAGTLPEWLTRWTYAGCSLQTSNGLTLALYRQNVRAGDAVTLGTNGGSNDAVNYVVLATEPLRFTQGDVNLDGVVNAFDLAAAKRGVMNGFTDTRASASADFNADGNCAAADIRQLRSFLLAKP